MSEWISVEDRLPPDDLDTQVLAIVTGLLNDHCSLEDTQRVVNYDKESGFWDDDFPEAVLKATHWMHLPDFPEEVQDDLH